MEVSKSILVINSFFLLCCIAACSLTTKQVETGVTHIDLEFAIDHKFKGKSLNEFCDTILYVPLETNNSCLLDEIKKVEMYNEHIFVSDHYGVYKFAQNGKFICKVGNKGRGPDEYTMVADFFINHDTLFVRGWNQLYAYCSENTCDFISSIRFDNRYPKNYVNKTGNYFVSFNFTNNSVEFFDGKGRFINSVYYKKDENAILDRAIYYSYYNILTNNSNSLNITTFCNDTIFGIAENCNLFPKYVINLGKYKIPEKYRPDFVSWDEFCNNSLRYLRKIPFETKDFLFVQIGSWHEKGFFKPIPLFADKKSGLIGLGVYDKRQKYFSMIAKNDKEYPCFYPNFSDGENHLLSFVNPIDAINFYEKCNNKNQLNKSFCNVLQNLKVDSNPVIVIAKLRE